MLQILGGTCRSAKEPGTYAERQQMTALKPVPPTVQPLLRAFKLARKSIKKSSDAWQLTH